MLNKYSYHPECDCMQLSTVLPEGMVFPYDFGFSPTTEFCFAVRGKGTQKLPS